MKKKLIFMFFIIVIIISEVSVTLAVNEAKIKDKKTGEEYTITPKDLYTVVAKFCANGKIYEELSKKELLILAGINTYDSSFITDANNEALNEANFDASAVIYQPNGVGGLGDIANAANTALENMHIIEEGNKNPENAGKDKEEIQNEYKQKLKEKGEKLHNIYYNEGIEDYSIEELKTLEKDMSEYLNDYKDFYNGQEDTNIKSALEGVRRKIENLGGDADYDMDHENSGNVDVESDGDDEKEYTISGTVIRPGGSSVNGSDITSPADNPEDYRPGEMGDNATLVKLGGIITGGLKIVGIIASVLILVILGIKYMTGTIQEKAEYKKTMIPYIVGAVFLGAGGVLIELIFNLVSGLTF